MNDLSNSQLGQYQLFNVIGKGGMATVYRARQLSVGRDVAVKVLSADLVGSEEFIARFEREAHIIAGLQHPHILTVYDFGREGRLVYLVMRLMEGSLSKELATARRLSQPRVITLVNQIASALGYAQAHGIVHRDLKPTNVLLDEDGNAYLTDFGIAKMVASNTVDGLTQPGSVMGTPSYMAPEQWRSEAVDGRTDIYALGIMTYQMLVGQVPFNAETPHGLMYLHLDREPTPPHTLNPALPRAADRVIAHVLAKDPNQRFATAPAFAQALEQALIAPDRYGTQPPARPQADVYDRFAEHDLMSRAADDAGSNATMMPTGAPQRPSATQQAPVRPPTPQSQPAPQSRPASQPPSGQIPTAQPSAAPLHISRPSTPASTVPPVPPESLDQPAVRSVQQSSYTPPGGALDGAPTGVQTPYPTGAQTPYPTGVQTPYPTGAQTPYQTGVQASYQTGIQTTSTGYQPNLQIASETRVDNPVFGCVRSLMLVVIVLALFGGALLLITLVLRSGGDDDSPGNNPPSGAATAPATLTGQPGIPPSLQILAPQGEVTMGIGQSLPIQFIASSASGVTQVELRRFSQTLDTRIFDRETEAQGEFSFVPDATGLHFLEVVAWSGSSRGVSAQITVRVQ